MTPFLATYLFIALGILAALTAIILALGEIIHACPDRPNARPAALGVATGFAAIGSGGLALIGAAIPVIGAPPMAALLAALGLATLCLGLGFAHAMAILRGLLAPGPAMP